MADAATARSLSSKHSKNGGSRRPQRDGWMLCLGSESERPQMKLGNDGYVLRDDSGSVHG